MCLLVDPVRRFAVGRIDEAEDLAFLLVDPVVLVVDAVLVLHLDVGRMGPDHVSRLDSGDVVLVHVCWHAFVPPLIAVDRRRPLRSDRRAESPTSPRLPRDQHSWWTSLRQPPARLFAAMARISVTNARSSNPPSR